MILLVVTRRAGNHAHQADNHICSSITIVLRKNIPTLSYRCRKSRIILSKLIKIIKFPYRIAAPGHGLIFIISAWTDMLKLWGSVLCIQFVVALRGQFDPIGFLCYCIRGPFYVWCTWLMVMFKEWMLSNLVLKGTCTWSAPIKSPKYFTKDTNWKLVVCYCGTDVFSNYPLINLFRFHVFLLQIGWLGNNNLWWLSNTLCSLTLRHCAMYILSWCKW